MEEILELLLKNPNGWTLCFAAQIGNCNVVKDLIKKFDPSVRNNYCIRKAASNGHFDIVKLLLEDKRVNQSVRNNYPFNASLEKGYLDIAKLLIEYIDLKVHGDSMLYNAVSEGRSEIVSILLEKVEPDNEVIWCATLHNRIEVVKILLEDGKSKPNRSCLREALRQKRKEIAELLLKDGRIKVDDDIIYWVVGNGYIDCVKFLLQKANEKRCEFMFRVAAETGHFDIVKLLLDKGCDPSHEDNISIRLAISHEHEDIFNLLIQDERVKNTFKIHLRLMKIVCKNVEIVKILLPFFKGKRGPLIVKASKKGYLETVKLLLN